MTIRGVFIGIMLFAIALAGCARPLIMLDRVLVQNSTMAVITEVRVHHEPTKTFGDTNTVLPQAAMDIGFSKSPMLADTAVIGWKDESGRQWKETLKLPYDRDIAEKEQSMTLVYVIKGPENVTVLLQASSQ